MACGPARRRSSSSCRSSQIRGPTHFGDIHDAAVRGVQQALRFRGTRALLRLTFQHLSPGTPAMAAVWVLLSKTRFPAELIQLSRYYGVHTVSVPFDISADYLPDLLRDQDAKPVRAGSATQPPPAPEFADIVHRSAVMARLIERAGRVAVRNVPALVEGESGTGKELVARAIHGPARAGTVRSLP